MLRALHRIGWTLKRAPVQWPISLRLPAALVAEIDAIAVKERRPRVKMIEVVLDEYVQGYRHKAAA